MGRTQKRPATTREADLETEIRRYEELADEARDRGAFTAAVSSTVHAGMARRELERLRDEAAAEAEVDPVRRVARLRRCAAEDGSWVAASNLLRQEQDLIEDRRKREEEAAKAARKGMTEDELIESLCSRITAMPARMRSRVLARLTGQESAVVEQ